MKRIVYYIIQSTAEENESGTFHYSKPFITLETAQVEAEKIQNDFVAIEKHHEYDRGAEYKPQYRWEIDHNFDIELIYL
jgi:hypothetical protein